MADNITVLDSTGTSKNWATSEGSDSQHRQHVVPTDADGTAVIGTTADAAKTTDTTGTVIGFLRGIVSWFARLGGLDGAAFTAGSSYVWPGLAGVYQSTVGTLMAGQSGLARLTSRRAVVTAGDNISNWASSSSVSNAGDIVVSTTSIFSGFSAPTTAFFDGTDPGFGASARYIRIPMLSWEDVSILIYHNLGVDLTCSMSLDPGGAIGTSSLIASQIVSTSTGIVFSPYAGGTGGGANLFAVPAMSTPTTYLSIALTPSADPSVGSVVINVVRRA